MQQKLIKNSKDYIITDCGKVFNSKGWQMKFRVNGAGYAQLGIRMLDGQRKFFVLHRLVAAAFIDNPENKPHVNHIDGNKLNNHVSNLEWCTPKENMYHAVHVLGQGVGDNNGNRVISSVQAEQICKLLELGHTNYEIAEAMEITLGIVTTIRSGKCWKNISSKYKIPRRSRVISDDTVRWICTQIADGKTTRQIMDLSDNPRVVKCMINDIRRRGLYSDISKDYF